MKRYLLIVVHLVIINIASGQLTQANSLVYQFKPDYNGFTQSEIAAFISASHFENFRLLDQRVTLAFDNGFDIILLSANELKRAGVINDVSAYQSAFPPKYKLPVFHINQKGQIAAAYTVSNNVKFSRRKQ